MKKKLAGRSRQQPRKPTGTSQRLSISFEPGTTRTVERIEVDFPNNKEAAESVMGKAFMDIFNDTVPLGIGTNITSFQPMTTEDLDFRIVSSVADYLELAEMKPMSEPFGRAARVGEWYNVYDYALWIFTKLVKGKSRKYGKQTASRTILLLYSTHMEFAPSNRVIECLTSWCRIDPQHFVAVFALHPIGDEFMLELVAPSDRQTLPPKQFKNMKARNFDVNVINVREFKGTGVISIGGVTIEETPP